VFCRCASHGSVQELKDFKDTLSNTSINQTSITLSFRACKSELSAERAETRTDLKQERGFGIVRKSAELYDNRLDGRLCDWRDTKQHSLDSSTAFHLDTRM
jgi:hypothetical protein